MLKINYVCCIHLLLFTHAFPLCMNGTFEYLDKTCRPYLTCSNLRASIEVVRPMSGGHVKRQLLGRVDEMLVVYSIPVAPRLHEDFSHGLRMLVAFQKSEYVSQVVGYCAEKSNLMLATKYYKHGPLYQLHDVIKNFTTSPLHGFRVRARIAIEYTSILHYLHNSPLGVRVMCDSNDLKKTLSQFLITDSLHVVVNDLDALPEVDVKNNRMIKCGHRQLFGEFVAPEQLWPHIVEFNDEEMHGYDEKTDIWKIPDVLTFLLGSSSYANQVKFRLFALFQRCKDITPLSRPNMMEIREQLSETIQMILARQEL